MIPALQGMQEAIKHKVLLKSEGQTSIKEYSVLVHYQIHKHSLFTLLQKEHKVRVYKKKLDSMDEMMVSREIRKRMEAGEPVKVGDMKEFLARECGKEVCYDTVRRLIHQLGFRLVDHYHYTMAFESLTERN